MKGGTQRCCIVSGCVALLTCAATACSGPGAQSAMIYAEAIGKLGFGINAILSVVAFSWYRQAKKGPAHPVLLAFLLVAHPTFYVGVYSGDCGGTLGEMTIFMFGLTFGLALWQKAVLTSTRLSP